VRVAIIPARFQSTRFPGKVLADLGGRPMVAHVVDRARESGVFDSICIATDDARVADRLRGLDVEVVTTRADHATGTERVAEAAARLDAGAIVFNVQGDEPLLPPELLRELAAFVDARPEAEIATAAHPCADAGAFASPHVVKTVVDQSGRALYFSRTGIPHGVGFPSPGFLRHVGVYAFRRGALGRFVRLPRGRLEAAEGLEQLRALENGIAVHVCVTAHASHGVDTPADLKDVAARLDAFLESRPARRFQPIPSTTRARDEA
jgi:3-deoxy-manno-octulosonate cytidylyltransferase (CMP-KDO synthetase)